MTSPLIVVGVLVLLAVLFLAASVSLRLSSYRDKHPSIEARRKELDRAVMMDEITDEQYADRKIALEVEESGARLKRRLK